MATVKFDNASRTYPGNDTPSVDNGPHMIDIARWAMQKRYPVKVHSNGGRYGYKDQAQTPNSQNVTWTYEDGSIIVGQLQGL